MRLLLAWLAEPREALRRLCAALKPGGCLLAEEMDFVSVAPDPAMDAHAAGAFVGVDVARRRGQCDDRG
jgi:trans-aconitate methyltransferase